VTPDFYLPEAGIYIECTEMKPSLANRKRRKLRKLRTQYGEVVTYVDRRDFERLRARYLSGDRAGSGSRAEAGQRGIARSAERLFPGPRAG
jgi:hypothetical protein